MSQDINSVTLVGRLTRDSDLSYGASGMALAKFSIATNRRIKKGDQWTDEASFFDIALFDKKAENMNKYLTKGTQVAIKGELRQDRWERDGQKHSKVTIAVETIQLIGGKREGESHGSAPSVNPPIHKAPDENFDPGAYEDDIPF